MMHGAGWHGYLRLPDEKQVTWSLLR
jgi:hypothetical protein